MPAQPFLGDIMLFAGNFAPKGWAVCAGQLLPISQNQALFSLLGTTYGGNGQTTFALPDLRGRVPMCVGQGQGLSPRTQGETVGEEGVALNVNQIPAHTHTVFAVAGEGDSVSPQGAYPAKAGMGDRRYATAGGTTVTGTAVATAGGSQPHSNIMPSLALNYYIALAGIYPSRS